MVQIGQNATVSLELASLTLAKSLREEFSGTGDTKASGLQALDKLSQLSEAQQGDVRDELRKLVTDSEQIFDRITKAGRGLPLATFLTARLITAGAGADAAATAPEGSAKILETRVKVAEKPVVEAAADPFSTIEQMVNETDVDADLLKKMMADLPAADKKGIEKALTALEAAGPKALSSAGRYQLAMAKALKSFEKLPPGEAAVRKDKLFTQMQSYIAKTVLATADLTPDGLVKLGLPRGIDPAIVKKAIAGDPGAMDQLGEIVQQIQAQLGGIPKDVIDTALQTNPDVLKAAFEGDPKAIALLQQMIPREDLTAHVEKTREQEQTEREILSNISRTSSILSLINGGGSIDDILMAVMLMMLDDNDELIRQKTAEMERQRSRLSKDRTDRKKMDTSAARDKQITLDKKIEERATLQAGGPPAAKAVPSKTTTTSVTTEITTKTAAADAAKPASEVKISTKNETKVVEASAGAAGAPVPDAAATDQPAAKPAEATNVDASKVAETKIDATKLDATKVKDEKATETKAEDKKLAGTKIEVPAEAVAGAGATELDTSAQEAWAARISSLDEDIKKLSTSVDTQTSKLADADHNIEAGQSSMDKLQFQIQQLIDRRKMMFEMITKILSVFSQMAATATQNIR